MESVRRYKFMFYRIALSENRSHFSADALSEPPLKWTRAMGQLLKGALLGRFVGAPFNTEMQQ
ncbi:MAG: hypothetical protein WBX25_11080 [Rhodomicrobium sp.]